ncbi:tetratricopeptide repeat-containing sensor histidine kinase [Gelatiniphilus marinus]|uniref:histidine kinase n=1 Tax=Gelatiniphilus marinus TaxID=1759464 RepID=A0ABW5JUU9_9FLAO
MRKIITILLLLTIGYGFAQTNDLDSLSIKLAYQDQDSLKVNTSLKVIKLLYGQNDFDKALQHIILSEKLSTQIDYHIGIAETSYYKALIYAERGDYINAVSGYQKSKALYSKLNNVVGIAKVNNSIGLLEIKRGNYAKGLRYALSAIEVLEKHNLITELKLAYSHLAKAYYNINATDQAITYYLKALEIQEQLNDTNGASESYSYLAELFSDRKEHRKAIEYYQKLINTSNGEDRDSILRRVYPKLGGEYLKFNDYKTATKYLVRGYNLNIRRKDKSDLLITLNHLGELNIAQKRLVLAEKQLLEAGTIAKKTDNKKQLLRHYKLMKALDSTKNRFDRAFAWQREYYKLKNEQDKNLVKANLKIPEPEELDTNLEKTVPTLKTQTKPVPEKTNALPQNNDKPNRFKLIFYALLAALMVVSTFLILIYLKRNNTIKYTQELEEKNLKIQLQNQAYQEQTEHLKNANNVKDKLFSIVSHDLKDSLSSINGFIDLLRDGSLSREEFDNLIPELSENANSASLLLFNLLNWSKSQMQSLEPKPTLFDIQEVLEDKVKLIEQRTENKGITLINRSKRDFAYADKSMFEIIIQNLLANALKFSRAGDTITISNRISNGNCIVSVADTGIGISKENTKKLFKNNTFTTLGTLNEKGTGLGLSICKELIELNNGKIWVDSTLGAGSTFYVQLPKSKPVPTT